MRALTVFSLALVLATLATLVGGCGATFDPPTEIKSLRVIGVQKDEPYAAPGDDVNLSLLWYDGTPAGSATPPRAVQIQWLGGCLNPPADSYEGCFAEYAAALSNPAAALASGFSTNNGATFRVHVPTEAEANAAGRGPLLHANADKNQPNYGLSYVFFSVCAGQIVPAPGDKQFPLRCVDSNGVALGANDFVLGYTAIYFFGPQADGTPYLNANPVIGGLRFGGRDVTGVSCFGAYCFGTCDADGCVNPTATDGIDCTALPSLCVPHCKDDADAMKCPEHEIALTIDPATFEVDPATGLGEEMWIDYYSTLGKFKSSTKLLNDATSGYNNEHFTEFYAPNKAGIAWVWGVVHDNRGGVSWVGTNVEIQ